MGLRHCGWLLLWFATAAAQPGPTAAEQAWIEFRSGRWAGFLTHMPGALNGGPEQREMLLLGAAVAAQAAGTPAALEPLRAALTPAELTLLESAVAVAGPAREKVTALRGVQAEFGTWLSLARLLSAAGERDQMALLERGLWVQAAAVAAGYALDPFERGPLLDRFARVGAAAQADVAALLAGAPQAAREPLYNLLRDRLKGRALPPLTAPAHVELLLTLAPVTPEERFALAQDLALNQRLPQARELWRRIATETTAADVAAQAGSLSGEWGDVPGAVAAFRRAETLAEYPQRHQHRLRLLSLLTTEQRQAELAQRAAAAEANPADAEALLALGDMLLATDVLAATRRYREAFEANGPTPLRLTAWRAWAGRDPVAAWTAREAVAALPGVAADALQFALLQTAVHAGDREAAARLTKAVWAGDLERTPANAAAAVTLLTATGDSPAAAALAASIRREDQADLASYLTIRTPGLGHWRGAGETWPFDARAWFQAQPARSEALWAVAADSLARHLAAEPTESGLASTWVALLRRLPAHARMATLTAQVEQWVRAQREWPHLLQTALSLLDDTLDTEFAGRAEAERLLLATMDTIDAAGFKREMTEQARVLERVLKEREQSDAAALGRVLAELARRYPAPPPLL